MKKVLQICGWVCVAGFCVMASSSADAGPNEKIAKAMSASWDMSGRIHGIHVLLTVRQEGNMYPGIFGGVNTGGKFSILAEEDKLTDELVVQSQGGFALSIRNIPGRAGMDRLVPGQAWMAGVGGKNPTAPVTIEFTEFTGWKRVVDKKDAGANRLEATFKGVMKAGERSVAITGPARFTLGQNVQSFQLDASTTFKCEELGGEITGPVAVRIRTRSPVAGNKPELPQKKLDLGDL